MSSDEQRVRTMAGWVGVEISRSRVRTPGRYGYGLYRVRPMVRSTDLPEDLDEMWTAYAFTLEMIRACVEDAVRTGTPSGPGPLLLRASGHGWSDPPDATVPTRWTSAYTGRRDLGGRSPYRAVTVACLDETEPDGRVCAGELRFADGDEQAQCSGCGGWVGRLAPLPQLREADARLDAAEAAAVDAALRRDTVRSRQRAANAEFQRDHKRRRDYGLVQRHAAKLSHLQSRPDA